ncbi:uncharacterized protein LOC127705942 [Mytilus californianus]|uniref:uncharacterized protein LOC127705942 n=1 Tax=Mytilus californianus TaxID=6549 RepID=UPI0022485748|nr:uncharacterized protein LOC127705942 [Mytilus californianus]XP_052066267.1 uncharacterized protein LOC127705942 [Mytilus californianus]XP_052066268.1 uncharacterized protein LOC127705942 [Mytilus californianus]XP_052066269.1 uncharacterized protein LOC127705942 [Mytilus californianus]
MEKQDRERLRIYRADIINNLEAGDILDYLHEDEILTNTDCELIFSGKTRKERSRLLIDTITRRGPKAYSSFTRALNLGKYKFLNEKISSGQCRYTKIFPKKRNVHEIQNSSNTTSSVPMHGIRTLILENVEPNDILDILYKERVISEDEYETVRECRTRRSRCSKLLYLLSLCHQDIVLPVLNEAFNSKYDFIKTIINQTVEEGKFQTNKLLLECAESSKHTCIHDRHQKYMNDLPCKICVGQISSDDCKCYMADDITSFKTSVLDKRNCRQLVSNHPKLSTVQTFRPRHSRNRRRPSKKSSSLSPVPFSDTDSTSSIKTDIRSCFQSTYMGNSKSRKLFIFKDLSIRPPLEQHQHLLVAFNYLSTLINEGKFDIFQCYCDGLKHKYTDDYDLNCLIMYLQASRELFRADSDKAKKLITNALEIVPKTSNPKYFTTELLSAKSRMFLSKRQFEKFQTTIDDAKMIVESDPLSCTGHAAGWLYLNDARYSAIQIGCINFQQRNSARACKLLHSKAKNSFKKSICHFQRDVGKDGPFGFGYALCRLVILLLQCGDNGRMMDILHPSSGGIKTAEKYLKLLEEYIKDMPKMLKMHADLAKCDYYFRIKMPQLALQYATSAHKLSNDLQMLEFSKHAQNRLIKLNGIHHLS